MRDVIETGDMEQLAVIVLNGEGKKLLGQRSELPEIQAFLDNVPSYMVSFFFQMFYQGRHLVEFLTVLCEIGAAWLRKPWHSIE